VSESRRKVAFAGATLVLLAITGLSSRESGLAPRQGAEPQPPAGTAAPIRTGPPPAFEPTQGSNATTPQSSPAQSAGSPPVVAQREREARNAPAITPRKARAATAAARAFLDGYLPYSYGQSDAGLIRAADRRLLRDLEASPPRVPATVGGARPRLISVRAEAATGDLGVDVLAVVDDGQRRYSIPLAVRNSGRRWIVTAVSG
jgi:hypothetical protein